MYVVLERIRGDMGDDVIIMNPDVVQALYQEGYLYDMAELHPAKAMTDAARQQCTIDGQVVSVPMTMITYGLFGNVIPGQNPDIKVEQWGNTCN